MSKKMLFFDIDGTLLPGGVREIPQSTRDAIQMARNNGHLAFINTGRTSFNIDDFIRDVGFDGYICGCGTYIYFHGQELFASTIPHDRCVRLIQLLRQCKIPCFYEENNHIYFDRQGSSHWLLDKIRSTFESKVSYFPDDLNDPALTFDKILAYMDTDSDASTFRAYSDNFLEYIDHGHHIAEITQKGYSKATGIQFMCDYLGIPLSDCYAFGDSSNDLPMLRYVPHSIAMGNSSREVLDCCSHITTDTDKDGIYNALKHFEII